MTKIYAVRHGESIANTNGVYQGQTYDKGLSVLGRKQAEMLGVALSKKEIERIISSPLKRTLETALIVSNALNLPIEQNKELIETNHGVWEGKSKGWIVDKYPEIIKSWMDKPAETKFPQGETFKQTIDRVGRFLVRTTWNENTLVVTHDNIVRIMIAYVKDMDMNDIWGIDTDPAGITTFGIEGINGTKGLKLIDLNDIRHLKKVRSDLKEHAL